MKQNTGFYTFKQKYNTSYQRDAENIKRATTFIVDTIIRKDTAVVSRVITRMAGR